MHTYVHTRARSTNKSIFVWNFCHLLLQDVRRGLNSIQGICKKHKIKGVFGPVIELLDCDEKLFIAVEVSAGNRCAQVFLPVIIISVAFFLFKTSLLFMLFSVVLCCALIY